MDLTVIVLGLVIALMVIGFVVLLTTGDGADEDTSSDTSKKAKTADVPAVPAEPDVPVKPAEPVKPVKPAGPDVPGGGSVPPAVCPASCVWPYGCPKGSSTCNAPKACTDTSTGLNGYSGKPCRISGDGRWRIFDGVLPQSLTTGPSFSSGAPEVCVAGCAGQCDAISAVNGSCAAYARGTKNNIHGGIATLGALTAEFIMPR